MIFFKQNQTIRFVFLFSVLVCALFALAACVNSDKTIADTKEETIKVTIIRNFKAGSLDPHNSWEILRAGAVETLVRLDEHLELTPWLATDWATEDNITWVFTIREGVSFHDGTTMDAEAVKASFERGIAVSEPLVRSLKIASMEAKGQELIITTTEPHSALPSELVNPYTAVISVQAEEEMGTEAFNNAPVGTGPFKVKEFIPNIEIQLVRFDEYWDGTANLDEVFVKFNEDGNVRTLALLSKEADIVYSVPAETVKETEKDDQLKVESVAGLRVHFLLFNQQQSLLQDVHVRRALDLLLDRGSIAKDIMNGHATPANGPFNSTLPIGSKDGIQPLNISEAKQLLEKAGYISGADGKLAKEGQPLKLQLITYQGRPELPLMAQLLQSDAAKAGITIEIKTVENVDAYLRENLDWHIVTYSNLSSPRGDAGYFLNSALIPGGSLNPTTISIDKLSEIVNRLNAESGIDERNRITHEAVAVIKEEVPHAYAVYPNIIVGMNKRVINWKPGAEEYYIVTNKMDVK